MSKSRHGVLTSFSWELVKFLMGTSQTTQISPSGRSREGPWMYYWMNYLNVMLKIFAVLSFLRPKTQAVTLRAIAAPRKMLFLQLTVIF